MTTSLGPPRALAAAALAAALLVGCAHAGRRAGAAAVRADDVTAEDIDRTAFQSVEQMLAARVPGLELFRTADGGTGVRIRGLTSLANDGQPLYVVDGAPILGRLEGISPHDIQSVSVVKNPEASARFGLRAINGAIVIRTRDRE